MTEHNQPAMHVLIRLHAEIGGRIKDNAKEATKLRSDMKNVEAVLHLLEPTFNARRIASKRKNSANPWFKRGTIYRAVLDVLRTAEAPMSGEEIAVALLASKGVQNPTKDQRWHLFGAVDSSLRNNAGKSVTAHEGPAEALDS